MKKLLCLLAFLPCVAFSQGVAGAWTITPGTVAPGGGGGGGGTPGGSDGDWQINVAGSFGGITPATGWNALFVAPLSANLAAWITDATGTAGNLVLSNSPTIDAPNLTGTTTVATMNTTTLTATTFSLGMSAALGTDDTYSGMTITGLLAGATISQWEAVYIGGSSTYLLADANGTNTYPARGLAVAAYSSTNPAIIVVRGTVRNDAWAWTPGGAIYLSGTPGALTQTAPSTSGDKVQAIGYALTADIAFFDFDSTYVTVQ